MSDSQLVPANQETGLTAAAAEFIPFQHHREWLDTPAHERERIKDLISAMERIQTSEAGVLTVCGEIALENRERDGWSKHNLKTLFYAWVKAKDWRALRRNYKHESALPVEFINYLRAMVLVEHRSRKQAINRVREAWRNGEKVPGYGTWREWFAVTYQDREVPKGFCGDYPKSWGDRNFYNKMPSRAQHKYATRGLTYAQSDLPHIIRDTSKLRPLELVVFDDFKTDIRVIAYNPVLKKWEIVPCAGLIAMDVATRRILGFALVPRLTLPKREQRDDTTPLSDEEREGDDRMRKIAISRADLQRVLKLIFSRFGVPKDYPMTLMVENAAAAITTDLEAALDLNFGGQVRVSRTNMLEHRTLANGFTERGGKPWEKGWIESAINVKHNRAGNLPGQTGSMEQVNAPGDLTAKVAYAEGVLEGVSPEDAAKFSLPFQSIAEATLAYGAIFDWMDQRGEHEDHKMLGFDRIKEWCAGPGLPFLPMEKLALVPVQDHGAMEIRDRPQSPRERWRALCARCVRVTVPEFAIALLAYTPKANLVLRNHKLTFTQGEFRGTFLDTEATLAHLAEGTKLIGYYDPENPSHLFVTDQQGRAQAVLKRQGMAGIKNAAEISAAQAEVARWMSNNVQKPVRELLGDQEARLAEATAQNDAARASLGLPAISSAVRPGAPRTLPAPASPGDIEKAGDKPATAGKPAPRRISQTLARDQFAAPANRYAAAEQTTEAIRETITEERERAIRRMKDASGPTCDQDDLLGDDQQPAPIAPSVNSEDEPTNPNDLLD